MRITKVRLQNLNSLVGEWEVDLTADDFTADGIFAIIGPTGAGKTTILDAICLALYGHTPRLEAVTQSSNEIMSRATGECFAEVEFTTAQGRFRSFWSQHRARRLPTGNLQPANHEVSDMDTGKPLGEKLRDSREEVERVTGMDFERFTRSMLLAQGDFSKFLNASSDKRAPILEKITGTAIYSDISKHVHEVFSQKKRELEAAQSKLQGITALSEVEEDQLNDQVVTAQATAQTHEQQVEKLDEAVKWLEGIDKLTEQLTKIEADEVNLARDVEAFASDQDRLRCAKAALELDADHRELVGLRYRQNQDKKELATKQGEVVGKQTAVEMAETAQHAAKQAFDLAQEQQQQSTPILVQVRALDTAIGEKQKPIDTAAKQLESKRQELQDLEEIVASAALDLSTKKAEHTELQGLLANTNADAALVGKFAGINEQLNALADLRQKVRRTQADVADAEEKLATAKADTTKMKDEVENQNRTAEAAQAVLNDVEAAQSGVLAGHTLADLRERRDELMRQRDLLKNAVDTGANLAEVNTEVASHVERATQLRADIASAEQQRSAASELAQTRSKVVESLEDQVRLLQQISSLEEARKNLRDDAECPLCGSLDHPYARGNVPEPSAAEHDLQAAQDSYGEAQQQRHNLDVKLAERRSEVRSNEKSLGTARVKQEELLAGFVQRCQKLGLDDVDESVLATADEEILTRLVNLRDSAENQYTETDDIIKCAEEIDDQIKEARVKVGAAIEALAGAQSSAHQAELAESQAETTLSGHETDATQRATEAETAFNRLTESLAPFGVAPEALRDGADLAALKDNLRQRRDTWMQRQQEESGLSQDISEMTTQANQRADSITKLTGEITTAETHLSVLRDDLASARRERIKLFGDQDPGAEETRLKSAVDAAQESLRIAQAASGRASNDLDQLNTRIEELAASVAKRAEKLSETESAFAQRLAASEFADEASFVQASMPAAERQQLEATERALADRRSALAVRRQQTELALDNETAKQLTTATLAELQPALDEAQREKSTAEQQVGALCQQLIDNEQAKQQSAGAREEVDRREREYRRWGDLHALIGSGDGKKFRNFAQGLTFEIMINHANAQLRRMSDRYLLMHDEHNPLQLNVVDDYQASEIRSTKNLSGGESFIVSLALALGLSQMASRNVRVDSLFLDEGFGTLDEEALDSALTTLSSLQQEGKMIGIISHVGALKERIRAQLVVTPQAGGRSTLTGPGCRKVK